VKREDVEKLEKIIGQMEGLHAEIGTLAKKSPNDGLNKFKLKFVNTSLEQANVLLGNEYKPFDEFDKFDEDDVPSNSDVTMIIAQYLEAIERFRADHIKTNPGGYWIYRLDEGEGMIRTTIPKKLRNK
jgi:hypothetical protein